MWNLKAADDKNQKKLDKEIGRIATFFLMLESPHQGERDSAFDKLKASLIKINEFMGKTYGESGYFGLRQILEGPHDGNSTAQELEQARKRMQEYEQENEELVRGSHEVAAAAERFRQEVLNLNAEVERLKYLHAAGRETDTEPAAAPQATKSFKEFLIGGMGIIVLVTVLFGVLFEIFPWEYVFGVSFITIILVVTALRFLGQLFLNICDVLEEWMAFCADGTLIGVKVLSFSVLLLFVSWVAATASGLASLFGVDLAGGISWTGMTGWMGSVVTGPWGLIILGSGGGLYYLIRSLKLEWNLPEPLQWLIS
ncbi:MAG: hypothetical protein AB7S78_14135 [Candidatus Omnitrophota bacterium]